MAPQTDISDPRATLLTNVLGKGRAAPIIKQLGAKSGSLPDAISSLEGKVPAADLQRAQLADRVADLTGDDIDLATSVLAKVPNAASLRDIVLDVGVGELASLAVEASGGAMTATSKNADPHRNAILIRQRLFKAEPTAVVHRMIIDNEIETPDSGVRDGLARFFSNQPDFNIRQKSVLAALKHPDAFNGIPLEKQAEVASSVKKLQTVQTLSSKPDTIPVLMKANISSAFQVSSIPESTFVRAFEATLGAEEARQIHQHALRSRARNDHALVTMVQTARGSGIVAIDGGQTMEMRTKLLTDKLNAAVHGEPAVNDPPPVIDLESMFGSLDYCQCSDCQSVLSPAAYFVEILQFLRNNNLYWDTTKFPNSGQDGITGTVLEHLFARRPDLGCLELTCENTNTILPYVDLANEVMESFVVHRLSYESDSHNPKWAIIDVHNIEDETSSELLSEPQHTNYNAYCILKDAVFPIVNAPYHQAIDEARIFLNYLGTSRYELLSTFRPRYITNSKLSDADNQALQAQHETTLNRSAAAEYWGMTQVDYIAITRESYWSKQFWVIVKNDPSISDDDYHSHIGRKKSWEYWGYTSESAMQDDKPAASSGLMFVKLQFLPRSGLIYTDLADLVQTRYINPNYPSGRDLLILESIRFSYKYLQRLVPKSASDPSKKFARLAKFLLNWRPWAIKKGVSKKNLPRDDIAVTPQELCCWIKTWFEPVGKLIVLESNASPQLPIEGYLVGLPQELDSTSTSTKVLDIRTAFSLSSKAIITRSPFKKIGRLNKDGLIMDGETMIASVLPDSTVVDQDNNPFTKAHRKDYSYIFIMDKSIDNLPPDLSGVTGNQYLGGIDMISSKLVWPDSGESLDVIEYLPVVETCNIDNVLLLHLDGTPLTSDEWDRMQAFIRLYRKLGWTIDETDQALTGLAARQVSPTPPDSPTPMDSINDWSQVQDTTCDSCGGVSGSCGCAPESPTWCDGEYNSVGPSPPLQITADFLEEVVAVKTLMDLSDLTLVQLLTLWTDIPTEGNPSLYSTLFLVHSIYAIDPIFKPDSNGNYLTDPSVKISVHVPVLLAAFKLKVDGLNAVTTFTKMEDSLSLSNVSKIYRYILLGRILGVKVTLLPGIIGLFGDPFPDAKTTLSFVQLWNKMQSKNFTFAQLNYLIADINDPLRPIGPSMATVITTTKAIFDGLNAIDAQNPDHSDAQAAAVTDDLVTSKASQIFDLITTGQIVSLLNGTTVYSTNAPSGLDISMPSTLANKVQYKDDTSSVPPRGTLTVIGILTDNEIAVTKKLSSSSDWASAVDRIGKQSEHFFDNYLFGIFPNEAEAKSKLLAGDIAPPPPPASPADPVPADNSTAGPKRLYFVEGFMPFLRKILSQRLIISTVSGPANISTPDLAMLLLSSIIQVGSPSETALQALSSIQNAPPTTATSWSGYLIPPATDSFTFSTKGGFTTQPPALTINGQPVPFTHQQDDPNDVWFTDLVALTNGKLYTFVVTGQRLSNLQWKSARSPISDIPSSALLPDYSSGPTLEVFKKAYKAGLVINGFNLSVDELSYFFNNASDFDSVDFNAMTIKAWSRLTDYSILRDSMPAMPHTLLDLFKWAKGSPNPQGLVGFINSVTNWAVDDITKMTTPPHFNSQDPKLYVNEIQIIVLQKAITVKTKIAIDVDLLFTWSDPRSFFWKTACDIAESIRKQVRSRYDIDTWEQVAQPLFNTLRGHQRDALIAYLLVQEPLKEWGVVDADSLFEFFLIDVQMGSCLQTSRIKQAISTVQLFIERCLLNLEKFQGVDSSQVAQDRWQSWMNGYRLWQADREVFLWPENWLDPSLRDDKSIYFKALEAKLLQKDVNAQNVQEAMKNYLFSVDQVANLEVIGLVTDPDPPNAGVVHIFAKSRTSPWAFFYRRYLPSNNWTPWETMGVDILTYDNDNQNGGLIRSGSYILPVVWNSRLLVFLPQFTRKQMPQQTSQASGKLMDMGNQTVASTGVVAYWEIKMGWTECRNGTWTTKQITSQAITQGPTGTPPVPLPAINTYQFVPTLTGTAPDTTIQVGVFNNSTSAIGYFAFDGSQTALITPKNGWSLTKSLNTDFLDNYTTAGDMTMHSFQDNGTNAIDPNIPANSPSPLSLFSGAPVATYSESNPQQPTIQPTSGGNMFNFFDAFSHKLLARATTAPNVDAIYDFFETGIPDADKADAFGSTDSPFGPMSDYNELLTPYALYNWEIGCHVPMLMVNKLLATQQFDKALDVAHYVFNPFATRSSPPQPGDIWRWPPFKNVLAEDALEILFAKLKPNAVEVEGSEIEMWRDSPFQPFVVARSRRQAMMKWFAIKYINVLIAYGDYYFMQNTLETLPLAIQLYVRASHIYGPRAQQIPPRGKKKAQTYYSLLDQWDGFSNAVVQMELAFPFSNQTDKPLGQLYDENLLANIYGFATTRYFCVPSNPQLLAVRDLIDDRLYKIRHCQDINGVVRQLPLFEPPIDPGILVQAAAAGVSFASVINDLDAPMPNYKFYLLLQKALELCGELKSVGSLFLSTKEKIDAETLSNVRARQEVTISNLVMQLKTQALIDANLALSALQQSRVTTVYKMTHFINLLGEDLGRIPDQNTDYQELGEQIEAPSTTNNPMKLISYEATELSKASDANDLNGTIGDIEALASALHIIPNIDEKTLPWGLGIGLRWGAENFAIAASAIARKMKIGADDLSFESSNAGRLGGFLRQLQDRIHQVNSAGYELKALDAQIKTQTQKVAIASQDITNQQAVIDNSNEIQEYLKNKYTNVDLYSWMDNNLQTLHYQTYTLAYQIAKKAERAYCFERAIDPADANFISFGYWNQNRDGILAGENLFLGLKQLEAAYHEDRGYDFEITRHISLRQINPMALFELRENASCEVVLPEVFFDMDFPGHYLRRIKSVSLSIPCVVGPYTSISCTLRLLSSEYRVSSIATDQNAYQKSTDSDDARFRTANIPITSIAVSTAQNDSGLFELNFKDERYIPFEGAGAISQWRLELPSSFRQWDYSTITDVVVHIRYTSKDGGDKLASVASDAVSSFIKSVENLSQDQGLFAIFDLKSEFANEWARANTAPLTATGAPDPTGTKTITLKNLADRLPAYTKGHDPNKIIATDVYLLLSPNPSWVSQATLVTADGSNPAFTLGPSMGQMAVWQNLGVNTPISTWGIQFAGTGSENLTKGFIMARYQLG